MDQRGIIADGFSAGVSVGVTDSPIHASRCLAEVDPGHGAEVAFFGIVRERNLGRAVRAVSYDVFAPLATTTFRELATEARRRWDPSLQVFLWHRRGRLAVGEISVAIVVSSAHRKEAYEASRFLIEEVKHRAPVWKQEHYEDGDSDWVKGHALCQEATP